MADNVTQNAEELENFFERMTESYVTALDENLDAQTAFVDQWMESVEAAMSEEALDEQAESSIRAYEAWMDAAETSFDRIGDYVEGESVDVEEFRDIWLSAANRAFKETMSTTAFAAATGQNVDEMLQMRQRLDEATEDTLHALGFATTGDVREVGERLVETERRQHALEQQLAELSDEQVSEIVRRTAEIEGTLDGVAEQTADLDRLDRLDEMVDRLNKLDQRTAQLDRLDDIFTRLDRFDDRLDGLDDNADRLDDIEDALDDIEDALDDLPAAEDDEGDTADGSDGDEE